MNKYIKLTAIIFIALYFIVSFFAWDLTWASSCSVGGRIAYFFLGLTFTLGGIAVMEDNK